MKHWAEQFVGRPWEYGARGPGAFDCWGLFITVQHRFGIEVPDTFDGIDWLEFGRHWAASSMPVEGDAVLMRRPGSPHVGIWVDANGGRILHALEGVGVVLSDTAFIRMQGWRARYFKHVCGGSLH